MAVSSFSPPWRRSRKAARRGFGRGLASRAVIGWACGPDRRMTVTAPPRPVIGAKMVSMSA